MVLVPEKKKNPQKLSIIQKAKSKKQTHTCANTEEGDDVRVPQADERRHFRLELVLALQARGIQNFDGNLRRRLQSRDTKQRRAERANVDVAVAPRADHTAGGESIRRVRERLTAEATHAICHDDVGYPGCPWRWGHRGHGHGCRRGGCRSCVLGRDRQVSRRPHQRRPTSTSWKVCKKIRMFEEFNERCVRLDAQPRTTQH